MGYYTAYQLSIEPNNSNLTQLDIIADLRESCESAEGALSPTGNYGDFPCSWYNHEKDLSVFSKKYPDSMFILSGEGETIGDTWKCYFKNGNYKKDYGVIGFQQLDSSTETLQENFMLENDKKYLFNLKADETLQLDIKIFTRLIDNLRSSYSGAKKSLDKNGEFNNSIDWNNCDNDLINFTQRNPNIIITISCELPDIEDERHWHSLERLWSKCFYNGQMKIEKAFWFYNERNTEFAV